MKKKSILFIILGIFLLSTSCEKEIVLHPENSEEKVVVEAMFTDNPFATSITLTKTKGIYEGITGHPKITDAQVKIIDQTTQDEIIFTNAGNGKYSSFTTGIVGHQYQLVIQAEGQEITGTQTMQAAINLQRFISTPIENQPDKYTVKAIFDDIPNQNDYYLFIMNYADASADVEPRFEVASDLLYNDSEHSLAIPDEVFGYNQQWIISVFHIDRKNYDYLKVNLRAMNGLVNGAHPFYGISLGNPQNTVQGKQVMGYFLASPIALSPITIGN